MKKVYISQPMRGRATGDIIAERKRLMAEAAAALQVDDVEVLDTYRGAYTTKHPLTLLAWGAGEDGGRRRGDLRAELAGRPGLPGGALCGFAV